MAVETTPARHSAAELPGRPCSIATALSIVGERWALLAIREISLGNRRFGTIAAGTGAPRDILTARLRALESAGILYRTQYSEHPPRFEYRLTTAGRDLQPVLTALRLWGDRWLAEEPPVVFEHECGTPITVSTRCPRCEVDIDHTTVTPHANDPHWHRNNPAWPGPDPSH
ncbi:helix-turn-helix domain-containing protein [Nocardia sp. BMG111209]|uniref:winged helix-turn-helix transcriptional regulator n=1 Tax=Nocardia sp. BMG111209 TaxID=1160137 RepID=UPI00036C47FF|nr:helix-turn-helix domain-containing protein [Nocardia sp. BMG111209]